MSLNVLENLKEAYKLIYKLLIFPESDWKTKIYASTAMAYLINPYDVIPEAEKASEGYIDDLYLCLLVLKDLLLYRKDLIELANDNRLNIEEFVEQKLIICKEELCEKTKLIEKVSGYDSLKRFDIGNSQVDPKISSQIEQNSTILGTIAFFYDELLNVRKTYEEIRGINNRGPLTRVVGRKMNLPYTYHHTFLELKESNLFFDLNRICLQFNKSEELKLKIDSNNSTEDLFMDYEDNLKNFNEDIKYYEIIKFAHPLFKTLCNISNEPDCNWHIKHEINSALAYFSLVDDVIDDTIKSGLGYIDDIFVASFVLFDIAERDFHLLNKSLDPGLNITTIKNLFEKSSEIINDDLSQIINLLGLRGLMSFFDLHQSNNNNGCIILNHSSNYKKILNSLISLYFIPELNFDKKSKMSEYVKEINKNLSVDQLLKLNKFIEIAENSCYNKNIQKEFEDKEHEDIRLLILKHKILSS